MSYAQFDSEGNMVDAAGGLVVPRHVVDQYVSAMQRQGHTPQFRASSEHGFALPIGLRRYAEQGGQISTLPAPHSANSRPSQPFAFSPTQRNHQQDFSAGTNSADGSDSSWLSVGPATGSGDNARGGLGRGRSGTHTHNTPSPYAGTSALPAASPVAAAQEWLPEDFSSAAFDSNFQADTGAWLPSPASHLQQQPALVYDHQHEHLSPQRSRHPTPSIRVTTDFPAVSQGLSQPQDALYSASSVSPHHSYNTYHSHAAHLSPNGSYSMPHHESDMQTPVSPISGQGSPHDPALVDHHQQQQQIPRKRSHSIMSQHETQALTQQPQHSRTGSVVSVTGASPNDLNDEGYSPRGSRAFKRGDPPTNHDNKYICEYSEECRALTFDRKCEWSKHMDKHDRPYRCPHPSCAKLQGFTYSGGLLRHEREVHGKHGGPKSQLMCPHVDCKRHSGKGFTRKENLNEHIRRVHPKDVIQDSQYSQASSLRRDTTDVGYGPDEGETPASRISETAEHDEYSGTSPVLGKRKRTFTEGSAVQDIEAKDEEIKRLRAELEEERAARRRMEEDYSRFQEEITRLSLLQAQSQQPPQQQEAQV